MNPQTQLKLQAFLDDELSGREAREMAALLESDPEAQALVAELKDIGVFLRQNEGEVRVPESREFYWSKIERAIAQASDQRERETTYSVLPRWLRLFAPAAGLAVVLVTALSLAKFSGSPAKAAYLHEIETPLQDTGSMSFYSASAGMTVVWVQTE